MMTNRTKQLNVLIINDNHTELLTLESMFLKLGAICVDKANTAEEGLNQIYEKALDWHPKWYDIIFVAFDLPIIEGHVLAKIIRETEPRFQKTPIMATTHDQSPSPSDHYSENGLTDSLPHPITEDKLEKLIAILTTTGAGKKQFSRLS